MKILGEAVNGLGMVSETVDDFAHELKSPLE
jgi:hypothetical protein